MNYLHEIQVYAAAYWKMLSPFVHSLVPRERLSPVYLGSALIISLCIYKKNLGARSFSSAEFLKFCFPAEIYFNRSAMLDFIYYLTYQVISWVLIAPVLLSPRGTYDFFWHLFNQNLPAPAAMNVPPLLLTGAFTMLNILAVDFSNFITHYYQHKIPWLWEFHKTHHSAAVLTPMTVYRVHPVDNLLTLSFAGILTGLNLALFSYFFPGRFSEMRVLNLNLFLFLFYFLGFNLRHSHVWLSYPARLSRFFMSPAQHQIHHSKTEEHRDKNFGFLFAFWDLFAGSLVIPHEKMEIQYGLPQNEEVEYSSIARLFLLPFVKIKDRLYKPKMVS